MSDLAHYTLDRFEDNNLAILEDNRGCSLIIPKAWLPINTQEGDVLSLKQDTTHQSSQLSFALDKQASNKTLERLERLHASLPQAPEGDISI